MLGTGVSPMLGTGDLGHSGCHHPYCHLCNNQAMVPGTGAVAATPMATKE